MWPDAVIRTDTGQFTMLIPNRRPKRVAQRTFRQILADAVDQAGDGPDVALQQWESDAVTMALDSNDEAWQHLAVWAVICLTAAEAPNYVEQELSYTDTDGVRQQAVITAARSTGQTPHQLRLAAEARIVDLEARNSALLRQVREVEAEVSHLRRQVHTPSP